MSKRITIDVVKNKVNFLNRFIDDFRYRLQVENNNYFILFQDYGCEGSDCVYAGHMQGCNNYLNRIIRKFDLRDYYNEENCAK